MSTLRVGPCIVSTKPLNPFEADEHSRSARRAAMARLLRSSLAVDQDCVRRAQLLARFRHAGLHFFPLHRRRSSLVAASLTKFSVDFECSRD